MRRDSADSRQPRREAGLITTSAARGAWLTCRVPPPCRRRAPRAASAMPLTPLGAAGRRDWGRRACRRGGSRLTTLKQEASGYTFTLYFYYTYIVGSCIVLCWKGRASTPKSIRLLHRTYGPCGCCRPRTQCRICTWEMGQKSFMISLWDCRLLRKLQFPIG